MIKIVAHRTVPNMFHCGSLTAIYFDKKHELLLYDLIMSVETNWVTLSHVARKVTIKFPRREWKFVPATCRNKVCRCNYVRTVSDEASPTTRSGVTPTWICIDASISLIWVLQPDNVDKVQSLVACLLPLCLDHWDSRACQWWRHVCQPVGVVVVHAHVRVMYTCVLASSSLQASNHGSKRPHGLGGGSG